jgi:hypothetical protein
MASFIARTARVNEARPYGPEPEAIETMCKTRTDPTAPNRLGRCPICSGSDLVAANWRAKPAPRALGVETPRGFEVECQDCGLTMSAFTEADVVLAWRGAGLALGADEEAPILIGPR